MKMKEITKRENEQLDEQAFETGTVDAKFLGISPSDPNYGDFVRELLGLRRRDPVAYHKAVTLN